MLKKRIISTIIALFLIIPFSSPLVSAEITTLTDLDDSYYKEGILLLLERGIVNGYPDQTFQPKRPLNRAEMLKIVIEASTDDLAQLDLHASTSCFEDVPAGLWFTKYICHGKAKGLVEGYENGRFFKPEQTVNFVEALKMTMEAFELEYQSTPDVWYRGLTEAASLKHYIPPSIDAFGRDIARDETAELVARIILENEGNLESHLAEEEENDLHVTYESITEGHNFQTEVLARPETMELVNLSSLADKPMIDLVAINNSGEAVGSDNWSQALWWRDGVHLFLDGEGSARGINNNGEVIVNSFMAPFLINDNLEKRTISFPLKGIPGVNDINNHGQVVGGVDTGGLDGGITRAFLWEDGSSRELPGMGGKYDYAYAINNLGQVLGEVLDPSENFSHAVLWENGIMKDLGTFGEEASYGIDINDHGQIVGKIQTYDGHGYPFLWEDGSIQKMNSWHPKKINNTAEIVGSYNNPFTAYPPEEQWRFMSDLDLGSSAAYWKDGEMIDLNDLLSPGDEVQLTEAMDINDQGQIIVRGFGPHDKSIQIYLMSLPRNMNIIE